MAPSIIVIGAGITGVSAAEWARRAGADVTLIDKVAPGAPEQTSYGNAGILARCAVVPVSTPGIALKALPMLLDSNAPLFLRWRYLPRLLPWLVPFIRNGQRSRMEAIVRALVPLTQDSVDQHLALAQGTPAEAFIKEGTYSYIYQSKQDYEADGLGMSLRQAHGFSYETCSGADLQARDPHLNKAFRFAVDFPDHGWIADPGGYVAALSRHFEAGGGVLRSGAVRAIEGREVHLESAEILRADKIILAAGVWSAEFAKNMGDKVPLEAERGYHLFLKDPSLAPPHPYMIADAKFALTPMAHGLRAAGIVELAKLGAPPSQAPVDLLQRQVRRVYPELTWSQADTWMGNRPSTPDSLPILGASGTNGDVIHAFGSQHIGLTIGPRLGRMAADLAMGQRANMDLHPYRPGRF